MPKPKDAPESILELPIATRQSSIGSYDAQTRTAKMVFSTGARVQRSDWWSGDTWIEELSLDPSHVRLDRVRAGAVPFMKNHGNTVEDMMGCLTDASVDGKQGIADVKFSQRADVAGFVQDIVDGIARSVSVGYVIHRMEKVGEENGVPILRATDWEPFEVSSVAMPADAAAQFRAAPTGEKGEKPRTFRCEVRGIELGKKSNSVEAAQIALENARVSTEDQKTGEITMTETERKAAEEIAKRETEAKAAAEAAKKEGMRVERERQLEIRKMVRAAKFEESFAEELISDDSVTLDKARSLVIDKLATADRAAPTHSVRVEAGAQDETKTRRDAMKEAILFRGNPDKYKVTDLGREFAGLTLLEMARESLRRQGQNVGHMSRTQLAERAMHTTSDFPEITADIINKSLRDAFQISPQTFAPFTRRVQNPDFKQMSRVQLGLGSSLAEVGEDGEVTYGTMSDQAEKYSIKEYAKGLSISRKTIINDDLNAFVRIPAQMGTKARSLESDLVYAVLTANAAMADSLALFENGTHKNLAGSGAVISIASLAAARAALRAQKEIDGEPLNLSSKFIIVPTALETIAEQFIATIQPQVSANVNPFGQGGRTPLGLIVEPRLDTNSALSWYVCSGLDQVDMIELATLSGTTEPEIISEAGFDTLGMKFRVVHSVGVKAIDYRGLYKNPGA